MDHRYRTREAASAQADHDAWAVDAAAWETDPDATPHRRTGVFRRLATLLKLAVFVLPLALFAYGSVADCSGRPAAGWLGLVGAGACARSEMLGNILSIQDNFALLRRIID